MVSSIYYNLFSSEATKYVARYIYEDLRGRHVLYKNRTTLFSHVDFIRFEKFVCEDATTLKIKIDAILSFYTDMPRIRDVLKVTSAQDIKESMVYELNEALQGTYKTIYSEIQRICNNAEMFYGKINKKIIITPNIEYKTDGEFL